jgi:hypoxanthine-DNA glycosylase
MAAYEHIEHTLAPYYDAHSQILILGSLPSPKSREIGFYYGHPRNRFWKTLAGVYREMVPESIEQKQLFLKRHSLALWDVIGSCDIRGASDASIKNVHYNDLTVIISQAPVRGIVTTGGKATKLFHEHWCSDSRISRLPHLGLPSTSPANARMHLEDLIDAYQSILSL